MLLQQLRGFDMDEVSKNKWFGWIFVLLGLIAVLSGQAGWKKGATLDGNAARIVGGIMVIFGFLMIFPQLTMRSGRNAKTRDSEQERDDHES